MNDFANDASGLGAEAADWFFQNSLELFLVVRGGVVDRVNPAFCAITGWAADQLIGRSSRELTHPDDAELMAQSVQDLATKGASAFEHRLAKKDGGWLWVRCRANRTADGDILIAFQDITEDHLRKAESLEAQRSAELLRTAAGISVWRYKPDYKAFIMDLDFSRPVEGSGDRLVEAHHIQGAIHPDDAATMNEAWKETLRTGELTIVEYRNKGPEEGQWLRYRTAWRGNRPMASGRWEIIGITQNVTELAEARDAALQSEQEAHQAAEIKSQFLANMSHEIRTPMNGVLGVLHLLKHESLSEEGRSLIDEALGCGSMLAALLNDVIDFSKIEAGKLELSPEPIDPADALRGVAGMLRSQAEAKGLWLRTRVDLDLGWASIDPVRLRQMLFNLIGNAVKFTLTGGVEARMKLIGVGDARRLRVEIEDTGIGISPQAQGRLFERFHQADGSTTRKFGGSGLGLAITRTLAEIMGGEVGLDSTVGQGSTFWFEISAPPAEPCTAAGDDEIQWLEGLRILVVEDNATNRLIATKMLEQLGAEVTTANDGAQGVEVVQLVGFDLVLMDIQMPVMDGVAATRAIRALPAPTCHMPIIAMTANALSHQRQSYLEAGMNGSVAKPMSPSALLSEVARVSDGADEIAPLCEADPLARETASA